MGRRSFQKVCELLPSATHASRVALIVVVRLVARRICLRALAAMEADLTQNLGSGLRVFGGCSVWNKLCVFASRDGS